jgi:hypothetical protein
MVHTATVCQEENEAEYQHIAAAQPYVDPDPDNE